MSYMNKDFVGFCPTQQKDYSVSVTYCGDNALETKEIFSKERFDCCYQKFYGCKRANKCPIMEKAPHNI